MKYCVSSAVQEKISHLQQLGDKLHSFSSHEAVLLLRHLFSIKKLLFLLHLKPTFLSPVLKT